MIEVDKLIYNGQVFDSYEEVMVAKWLDELKAEGYVIKWDKPSDGIFPITEGLKMPYIKRTQLKTKVKEEEKSFTLLRPSAYTPDFRVYFSPTGIKMFTSEIGFKKESFDPNKPLFSTSNNYQNPVWFEVKPSFDQNNMERLFVLNQKFIWDKYKVFINLVEPVELFKKTFLPCACIEDFKLKKKVTKGKNAGKGRGEWKVSFWPQTLKQFEDGIAGK